MTRIVQKGSLFVAVCRHCDRVIGEVSEGGVALRAHQDVWLDHAHQLNHKVEVVELKTAHTIGYLGPQRKSERISITYPYARH